MGNLLGVPKRQKLLMGFCKLLMIFKSGREESENNHVRRKLRQARRDFESLRKNVLELSSCYWNVCCAT
jgi:hypothetical protein